jgi:uroporphyrinogen-III synthase
MQLIWTRSIDAWQEDKLAFGEYAAQVIHLPCVSHKSITPELFSNTNIDKLSSLVGLQAIVIITSLRCAKYIFTNKNLLQILCNKKIVCISSRAYTYLKNLNLRVHMLAAAVYASSVLVWLKNNIKKGDVIILPGPRIRAYDLYEKLKFYYKVIKIDIYKTISHLHTPSLKIPNTKEIFELQKTLKGIIFFASPSAVKGFVEVLDPQGNQLKYRLTAICIGNTTYSHCRDFFLQVHVSKQANIKSLLDKAREFVEK